MRIQPRWRRSEPAFRREHVVSLRGGERYRVRPARPSDEPALADLLRRLSPDEVRLRFFSPLQSLYHHHTVGPLAEADNRRFGLVAMTAGVNPSLVGHAMLVSDPSGDQAEFAVLVHHDHTRRGLGRYLLERLLEYAAWRGIATVHGLVLAENTSMLGLAAEMGFAAQPHVRDPGCIRVEISPSAGISSMAHG